MSGSQNLIEWQAVNKITGQVVELDALQILDGKYWEKVFVDELASMIGIGVSSTSADVLSYILKKKNAENEIHGTQREIAEILKVSTPTVNKVMKRLEDHGFLRQVRNGCYVLNPNVMHFGNAGNRHAILKIWNKAQ
jgi:Mn-dependent DtxR family transcriptional regulator